MLKLEKPRMKHFKSLMEADRDFESVGEEAYCGMHGRVGYMSWMTLVDRQAQSEMADFGQSPNEIYFLVDDTDNQIKGFGQLRPMNTLEVTTWAGHIGYSVPPRYRGQGYAKQLLKMLLKEGFSRGLEEMLLTCDVDNDASRHIIEKTGGQFIGFYKDSEYNKRVYSFIKEEFEP